MEHGVRLAPQGPPRIAGRQPRNFPELLQQDARGLAFNPRDKPSTVNGPLYTRYARHRKEKVLRDERFRSEVRREVHVHT